MYQLHMSRYDFANSFTRDITWICNRLEVQKAKEKEARK